MIGSSVVLSVGLALAPVDPGFTTPLPELVGVGGETERPPDQLRLAPPPPRIVVRTRVVPAPVDERRVPTRASALGQLGAGVTLLGVGLAGVGVLTGGLYLQRAHDREQARLDARPDIDPASLDLAPLDAQARRARAMIGAGTVMAAAGLALGTALTITGARAHHRLTIAPTLTGATLQTRF